MHDTGFAKGGRYRKNNILVAINERLKRKVKLPVESPFREEYVGAKIARIAKEELK